MKLRFRIGATAQFLFALGHLLCMLDLWRIFEVYGIAEPMRGLAALWFPLPCTTTTPCVNRSPANGTNGTMWLFPPRVSTASVAARKVRSAITAKIYVLFASAFCSADIRIAANVPRWEIVRCCTPFTRMRLRPKIICKRLILPFVWNNLPIIVLRNFSPAKPFGTSIDRAAKSISYFTVSTTDPSTFPS